MPCSQGMAYICMRLSSPNIPTSGGVIHPLSRAVTALAVFPSMGALLRLIFQWMQQHGLLFGGALAITNLPSWTFAWMSSSAITFSGWSALWLDVYHVRFLRRWLNTSHSSPTLLSPTICYQAFITVILHSRTFSHQNKLCTSRV
jgi:hypothetical protein